MTDLRKTPLYAMHCASNARIVDFGGWAMPLHYGSQLDEHHAVRATAGMFDVSHMCVVDIGGTVGSDDVRVFLRYALANNIDKLKTPGRALYSCMLNARGGVVDDLIVYYIREDLFRIVVNAATAEADIVWLNQLNAEGEFGVTLMPRRDLAMIAVQGPHASEKVLNLAPAVRDAAAALKPFGFALAPTTPYGEMLLARTGYTGEDGFELMLAAEAVSAVWSKLIEAGTCPCGLGARDMLRLEAGMNLYGQDMDMDTSPLDAGLEWTVDLVTARDFVGKRALLHAGCQAVFAGLILCESGGVLRAQQTVLTAAGPGQITSGTFSPLLQRSIAFARLPLGVQVGDTVQVQIRNKPCAARVVKLPFVRHGKALVNGC
ncbi:MAG: aminomethyltransferase [Glomeribacter sp. 1016415]|nr:aminomethyltransferase [Glomeribacter sp. 1016415]